METSPAQIAGAVLRGLREKASLSQTELAKRVYASQSTISELERGVTMAKPELISQIDQELGADGLLIKIWPVTGSGSYSAEYVAAMEREASRVHDWEPRFVHGLLQTPEYAQALMRMTRPFDRYEAIEADVNARIERQVIFARERPPLFWFILDESALRRPIGGNDVMREQLERIEQLACEANIVFQVMRYSATRNPGIEGSSRLLEFLDNSPIWYTEGWYSGRATRDKDEVALARAHFDLMRASALPPDQSLEFIAALRGSHYEQPEVG
jgi:transcriptional regulator with XRE-family HTH domain